MEEKPATPRFQFTIRGMLWATFWAAIFALACRAYINTPEGEPIYYLSPFVAAITPFVAIGALFGRSVRGLVVGAIAVGVCSVSTLILVLLGFFD